MQEQKSKGKQLGPIILAIVLWLITFGLGLETIYNLKKIFILVNVMLGGYLESAEMGSLCLVYILGLAYLVFVIFATEYHRKRVGQPESWRLFGWTLAVEVSIYLLYLLL